MLKRGKITFELLGYILKQKVLIYTLWPGTEKAACVESQGATFVAFNGKYELQLKTRYLDVRAGELQWVSHTLYAESFQGERTINELPWYPVEYHSNQEHIREHFLATASKFIALQGCHYRHYSGQAFATNEQGIVRRQQLDKRVLVCSDLFEKLMPDYQHSPIIGQLEIRKEELDRSSDRIFCSTTVRGYCFGTAEFRESLPIISIHNRLTSKVEFAVEDLQLISWHGDALANLQIPPKRKETLRKVVSAISAPVVNDFIEGKGNSIVILLRQAFLPTITHGFTDASAVLLGSVRHSQQRH